MNAHPHRDPASDLSRRQFLKTSTATALAGSFFATKAFGQPPGVPAGPPLRVGLIGCGGRGTGAAAQALTADPNTKLVAKGDAFPDRMRISLDELRKQKDIADRVDVPMEKCFVGFDAYQQVIASGVDVVLLATPPHFRPIHLKAAVEAGKHVFAEKPVAVDAPGVRSVLSTCEDARMAKSTLMAILGRMATYTGQKITWDQAMNSRENLSPDRYAWDAQPPKSEIPVPGVTPLA